MRILYDHQVFSLQNAGGASRYHFELASHFSHLSQVSVDVCLGFNHSIYPFRSLQQSGTRVVGWDTRLPPGLPRYALNELVTNIWSLAAGKWDIYHPTLYRRMPTARSRRTVVTHHDCVQERFPELFSDGARIIKAKRRLYEIADAIICVSESSRNDLLHYYDIDRNKTHVVHHGVKILERKPANASEFAAPLQRPYLLYVGARYAYKNFNGLLEAFEAGGFRSEFDLVVIGGGPFSDIERNEVSRLGLNDCVLHYGSLSEPELAETYCRARLFIYPSLYEGFGFPPLEAMSLGCPVLAARTSSIPEICGDAAYYFDPACPGDLERGIRDTLNDFDPQLYISKGYKRASHYNWQTCASRTLDIYETL
jgi:glycosyltransferase involved in cell wall biosynthesis